MSIHTKLIFRDIIEQVNRQFRDCFIDTAETFDAVERLAKTITIPTILNVNNEVTFDMIMGAQNMTKMPSHDGSTFTLDDSE